MLNKVTLTNFQRHRSLEVNFQQGFTALRGSNEAGKSSLLRGICYALFGAKAMPESLDALVTWGEPVNTLKVELDLTIEGVTYSVKRGKSGAEVNYAGGIITGQTEVTAFLCGLLKADLASASRLMLAGQNEIRGALESGPKATTELIEKLAEFDQIDNLIELMQEKLALGSTATAEAALVRAQETLAAAEALAQVPDRAGLAKVVGDAVLEHEAATDSLEAAKKLEAEAQEAYSKVRELAVARDALKRDVTRAERARDQSRDLVKTLESVQAPDNAEARVSELREAIDAAGKAEAVRALYAKVEPLLGSVIGMEPYRGSTEQLGAQLALGVETEKSLNGHAIHLQGEIKLLKAQLTHGSCSFCGKDFSGVPEVAERNAATQVRIDALEVEEAETTNSLLALIQRNNYLRDVELASRLRLKLHAANPDYVSISDYLPPEVTWKGPDVSADAPDTRQLEKELSVIAAAQKTYDNAQAQLVTVREAAASAEADFKALLEQLSNTPEANPDAAQALLDAHRDSARRATDHERSAREHLRDAERAVKDAEDGYSRALKSLEDAREAVSARSAEIGALEFNNALLKKVKQARPLIADKLWALVLHAVSSYFSEIRGEKSRVTKEADGFKVNGNTVATLSGSTLDALGLAIRVALVRTFLPSVPFLVLDEPNAAMDDNRTNNMLGFLASCGFGQVLLVSHEEISESVADHVVQL
jgi:DNA repair exonuclease SbcCD ATPase subunit